MTGSLSDHPSVSDQPFPAAPDPSIGVWALAYVAAGGALGSLLRWGVSEALAGLGGGFPWATYSVNLVGSLCLGVLAGSLRRTPREGLRLFVAVGVLGGFTTFSTYAVEVVRHAAAGAVTVSVVYAVGSLVSCGIAAAFGLALTGQLRTATPTPRDAAQQEAA